MQFIQVFTMLTSGGSRGSSFGSYKPPYLLLKGMNLQTVAAIAERTGSSLEVASRTCTIMNFAIANLGVGFVCTGSEYILAPAIRGWSSASQLEILQV